VIEAIANMCYQKGGSGTGRVEAEEFEKMGGSGKSEILAIHHTLIRKRSHHLKFRSQ